MLLLWCRLLLGGILVAFYLIAALAIRDLASAAVGQPYLAYPNYGWAMGAASALLWLLTGLFSCCALPLPPLGLTSHCACLLPGTLGPRGGLP